MTKRDVDIRERLARTIHSEGDFEFAQAQVEHLRQQLQEHGATFATAMMTVALAFAYVATAATTAEETPVEVRMPLLLDVLAILQLTFELTPLDEALDA